MTNAPLPGSPADEELAKIVCLYEGIAELLGSELLRMIDEEAYAHLADAHRVIGAWLAGASDRKYREILATIEALTANLAAERLALTELRKQNLH